MDLRKINASSKCLVVSIDKDGVERVSELPFKNEDFFKDGRLKEDNSQIISEIILHDNDSVNTYIIIPDSPIVLLIMYPPKFRLGRSTKIIFKDIEWTGMFGGECAAGFGSIKGDARKQKESYVDERIKDTIRRTNLSLSNGYRVSSDRPLSKFYSSEVAKLIDGCKPGLDVTSINLSADEDNFIVKDKFGILQKVPKKGYAIVFEDKEDKPLFLIKEEFLDEYY